MKKLLVFLCATVIGVAFAETKNITWQANGTTYATSTCEVGNDLIIPQTNPTKYGYHFVGWLPYTFLEYIESTGTQYIDTGIVPANKKIGAVIDFQFTKSGLGVSGIFGSNNADGSDNIQFTVYKGLWRYKINNFAAYGNNYDTNRHIISFNMTDGTKLDNNIITSTQYTTVSTNTYSCFLGACSYRGTPSSSNEIFILVGKIYSAKIYDNGTLIQNFIPAKRTYDDAIGMYDTVTDTFFENAGKGTFIAGPEK